MEQLRVRLEAENKEIADRRRNTVNESREEARAILAQANSLIENTIREIRSGASNDQVKEMRRAIEQSREKLGPQFEKGPADGGFRKGDSVRLKGGAQVGDLEFDPDEKGNVVIQFGSIRMRSTVEELEAVSRKEMRKEAAGRQSVVNAEEAQTRLDLRGKYADEAVIELEQSLTAALNTHIFRIEVIHGKGTGALRRRLHDYLASHPSVAAYRLGSLTEGGAGVTIVELK